MPKTYSLLKVEDADSEGKTVTDKDADFHEKQKFRRIQISNTSTNTDALTLQTTNDNTASGPIMSLTRISANPEKSDRRDPMHRVRTPFLHVPCPLTSLKKHAFQDDRIDPEIEICAP